MARPSPSHSRYALTGPGRGLRRVFSKTLHSQLESITCCLCDMMWPATVFCVA